MRVPTCSARAQVWPIRVRGLSVFGSFAAKIYLCRRKNFWTMRFSGGHIYFGARCVVARAFTLVHVHWFSGFI